MSQSLLQGSRWLEARFCPRQLGGPGIAEELKYTVKITVYVRWVLVCACLLALVYRPDIEYLLRAMAYFSVGLAAVYNGLTHYWQVSNRAVSWYWILALAITDLAFITSGVFLLGGFHTFIFILYYPVLAVFSLAFTPLLLSLALATVVAASYGAICLLAPPGLDLDTRDSKILLFRIAVMYIIVVSVSLAANFERRRRAEAEERERLLQQERIALSEAIHNSAAQSAFVVGLGLESAMEMADKSDGELAGKLRTTLEVARGLIWELRHPIDSGHIYEGRKLGSVLHSHASTFTNISSVPTKFHQSGTEPELPLETRCAALSIAHNALTNAYRHSGAGAVQIRLSFENEVLILSIDDDGIGLPDDFSSRGHGFGNMREDAERLGGRLYVGTGIGGCGTRLTCVIPYSRDSGGKNFELE